MPGHEFKHSAHRFPRLAIPPHVRRIYRDNPMTGWEARLKEHDFPTNFDRGIMLSEGEIRHSLSRKPHRSRRIHWAQAYRVLGGHDRLVSLTAECERQRQKAMCVG